MFSTGSPWADGDMYEAVLRGDYANFPNIERDVDMTVVIEEITHYRLDGTTLPIGQTADDGDKLVLTFEIVAPPAIKGVRFNETHSMCGCFSDCETYRRVVQTIQAAMHCDDCIPQLKEAMGVPIRSTLRKGTLRGMMGRVFPPPITSDEPSLSAI